MNTKSIYCLIVNLESIETTQNLKEYLDHIIQFSVQGLLPVWKNIISLTENSALAQMVLHLSLENFYLQITDENTK